MMNADVTAENKPDWAKHRGKHRVPRGSQCSVPGARINAHENKRAVQIFIIYLLEIPVMFFHFALELVVELYPGVNAGSATAQHGLQVIAVGFFQSFAVR